jgi:hypothetical protein
VYIVLNDFGHLGRVYVEAEEGEAEEWSVIEDILIGQYSKPVRVVAFNTVEGWARDVSQDIARAVAELARTRRLPLPHGAREFVERLVGEEAITELQPPGS